MLTWKMTKHACCKKPRIPFSKQFFNFDFFPFFSICGKKPKQDNTVYHPHPRKKEKKSFLQFQFSRIETNEGLLRREVALDKKYHISRPNDAFIRKGKFEVTLNPLSTPRSFFRYFPLYLKEGRPPQLNEIAYRRRAGSIFGFWTCVVTTDKTIMYSNVAL